jgi:hypothetical protein
LSQNGPCNSTTPGIIIDETSSDVNVKAEPFTSDCNWNNHPIVITCPLQYRDANGLIKSDDVLTIKAVKVNKQCAEALITDDSVVS